MELSEISLDLNLIDNAIRYKFTDAPILSISIDEINDSIIILVATVSSLHHLKFTHPKEFSKGRDETQSFSVFHSACSGQSARDSNTSLFYVINPISASSKENFDSEEILHIPNLTLFFRSIRLDQPVPHAASCTISENELDAYFAVANQTNVILYKMNCVNGNVTHIELKENYTVPRILSNITDAFRYFHSSHLPL